MLYAIWQEAVTITFNTGMGYFTNLADYEVVIAKGSRIEKLPTPVVDDSSWVFAGWYKDEAYSTSASVSDKYNANTTLYAKWEQLVPCIGGSYEHLYGTWEQEQIAKCTTPGTSARYCEYCQHKQTMITEAAKGHSVTEWQESFMQRTGVCTRLDCGMTITEKFENVTKTVLGKNPSEQIEGSTSKFYSVPFTSLINDRWNEGWGEFVGPNGTGTAYVQFNFVEASALDRIYFKGQGVTAINIYVQYEGEADFIHVGVCVGAADVENTPYVSVDNTKKVASVKFVEENPPQGTSMWQEVAFTKAIEETIENGSGGAGGGSETDGVNPWNMK